MGVLSRIAEGGQTWAHRMRMLRQVLKIALLLSTATGGIVLFTQLSRLPSETCWGAWYHLKARVMGSFHDTVEVRPDYWAKISHSSSRPTEGGLDANRVARATRVYFDDFWQHIAEQFQAASAISIYAFFGILCFFFVRGKLSQKKEHLSGNKMASAWKVRLYLLIRRKASDLHLASLPLVKGSETQHILVTGGTGSGKTNCFHHLLPQVRQRGQRAVVIDVNGSLVDRYYREGDIILNPFDPRTEQWHPWIECHTQFDLDSLGESLIPQSHNERELYWRTAARSLFTSVLELTKKSSKSSDLTRWLLYESLPDLCKYVKGTKAASFLDINSEKTAGSIRSVAASFLECLSHLEDTDTPFSVGDWVRKDEGSSWLFLCCTPAQRSTLKPLIACWFSTAVRALMQLKPNFNRRLWFVIDELPALGKIKDLELLMAEARKYGGCALLALQSPAQLEAIYGREATQLITGNSATKIVFAERDPVVSERISKMFGSQEIREYQEGISYGAHEMRDGVSLSRRTQQRPVASPTQIQSLKDNQALIRLPGGCPVTKLRVPLVLNHPDTIRGTPQPAVQIEAPR